MKHLPTLRTAAALVLVLAAGAPAVHASALTSGLRREILQRELARDLGDGFLAEASRHDDPMVRARAFRALGRIQDPAALDALRAGLADADAAARREAAFATGQLQDAAAIPGLLAALEREEDPAIRRVLVLGLGKCGDAGAVEPLIALLGKPADAAPAAQALGTMAQRGVNIDAAGSALNGALRSLDPEVTWRAAFAVFRGKAPGTTAGLTRALGANDPLTRLFACRAIGATGQKNLGEKVAPLLGDPDWRVRVEALRALGATKNNFYVGQASILLEDPVEHVRLVAIETMGKLGPGGGTGRLAEYERSGDWRVRGACLHAKAEASGEGALIDLREASRESDWRVRKAAAEAFAKVPTEQALILIEPMLADETPQVVAAAVNSLVEFPQVEAVKYIRRGLEHGDVSVLTLAANGAAQRLDRAAVPLLVKAWDPLVSPVDTEPMTAVLDALGACLVAKDEDGAVGAYTDADRATAIALLEAATKDADANVANAAARALAVARGEDASVVPRAEAPLPPVLDLDRLVALEESEGAPTARLVTNRGEIVIRLLPHEAPGTVANFSGLAGEGYFNGLRFHRVVADFVVQGGDPRGDGWGGPGYAIRCEYNDVPYGTGTVGMALSGKDTGGSQFFITHAAQPHLDGRYTVFGEVVQGQDIVDQIQVGDTIQEIRIEGL